MKPILTLSQISVNYSSIHAVKGASIQIHEGQIVSLIGANGAGKSTLLKAIVGLEPISEGSIVFSGDTIAETGKNKVRYSPDKIAARGLRLVPEGRGVFAEMSVSENLEMGAFLERNPAKIQLKMNEMMDLFPILRDRRSQKAGSLSGGEQQMLTVARAMMSSPRLLLLDEPALGLAPLVIRDIFKILQDLNRRDNVTVFLVEQNAHMALSISHKGYVMETGRIVLEDTGTNLMNNPEVKAAYLGG